ncbi:TetR/AcrR family transcriptional regulator [Mycobacteroides abscessus]|nr:TetR family transcriptional regulator [Mycobacteroides abscessus]EIU44383.1 transcriptional regulator, TetR-family [Mycobacteroides abscessus 5S-1215]EIU93059.1 transcriptional regulator, TetR-family [Mycobacteroides abscessus 5S-0921]EIV53221.1 transcriptional regulator, TetR-family [Mycobacteroides abscessus 3A-0930-S]MBN7504995.1 TetR family transcriptional regulator [Mycobacteroides abscessus subsp. massiliense]CPS11684.1 Putative transcriptional regulator%2C TetR-family [Mycobacteroide
MSTRVGLSSAHAPEPRRSDATRAAILEAAQEHFASVGYEKATIRAIAGTAGIDPSLVMRYYGNKGKLFAAAANFDLCLPELSAVSHEELGTVIVQHFLERWEVDDTMVALLRAAVSNEEARLRMVEIFTDQSLPAFEELLTDHAAERAALIGGQMIGFAVCRYILRLSPVIEMTHQDIVNWMAPIVQQYIDTPAP